MQTFFDQTLIVASGCGLVQRWNGPIEEIRPGDVVWISPIDSVKVEMVKQSITEQGTKEDTKQEENGKQLQHEQQQPKAISMAEGLKK